MKYATHVLALGLLSLLPGCWWWGGPPHHGSGGTGGGAGTSGSGGAAGEVCAPDDEFLLVTDEVPGGTCGPIFEEIATPSSEGWFNPYFDRPCVVDGCHITCDRTYEPDASTYVHQELDLLLGTETNDNPMTIVQREPGIDCESDYLVDVTRVPAGSAARRIGGGRTVSDPLAR
jgi:hypothetical protein